MDHLPEPPDVSALCAAVEAAADRPPVWQRTRWHADGTQIAVTGVRLQDEVRWREEGDAWLFIVQVASKKALAKARRSDGLVDTRAYLAPGMRGGRADLAERVPGLAPLADSTVVVVGLGGIGAPAALEFVRGNVERLRIADFDVVEPGPSVRWPLGFAAVGSLKVRAIADFAAAHYPRCIVEAVPYRIGAVRAGPDAPHEEAVLDALIAGAHLVFDGSAEPGVQYFMSELCRQRGVPYVTAWTVPGASGAVVVRVRPDGGCWLCFQQAVADGVVTLPKQVGDGTLAPTGCADLSFTGTGFDVAQASLHGVQLAMSTLCEGPYPAADWDVGAFQFFSTHGLAPQTIGLWPLEQRPGCEGCGRT